jgi:hypothetical protein
MIVPPRKMDVNMPKSMTPQSYPQYTSVVNKSPSMNTTQEGECNLMKARRYQAINPYYFIYPEFEGEAGYKILREIIGKITPGTIVHTWEIVITGENKNSTRKQRQKQTANRDKITADFSNLYHLAHEYYEWEHSEEYTLYPPQKEYAEKIRGNHELHQKLIKFANYRKILEAGNE